MTTSEPTTAKDMNVPTTGEIVRALRCDGYCSRCEKWDGGDLPCPVMIEAADRLESQERKLVRITDELTALTARAEQAERERDVAVDDVELIAIYANSSKCNICKYNPTGNGCELDDFCDFKWRGLPQDGEGL